MMLLWRSTLTCEVSKNSVVVVEVITFELSMNEVVVKVITCEVSINDVIVVGVNSNL